MEIRQGSNRLCWIKKSRSVVFGESLGISSVLATHLHGRNAAYPASKILFLEAFIHSERLYFGKLVGYTGPDLSNNGGMPRKFIGKSKFFILLSTHFLCCTLLFIII